MPRNSRAQDAAAVAPVKAPHVPFGPSAAAVFMPFLMGVSEAEWNAFRPRWEAYRLRGGKEPVRNLVYSHILPVLEIQMGDINIADASDEEFIAAVNAIWAPRSVTAALRRLQDLSMPKSSTFDKGPIIQYGAEFLHAWQSTPASIRPSAKKVASTFLNGLKPTALAQTLRLTQKDNAPVTALLRAALTWLDNRAAFITDEEDDSDASCAAAGTAATRAAAETCYDQDWSDNATCAAANADHCDQDFSDDADLCPITVAPAPPGLDPTSNAPCISPVEPQSYVVRSHDVATAPPSAGANFRSMFMRVDDPVSTNNPLDSRANQHLRDAHAQRPRPHPPERHVLYRDLGPPVR